MTGSLSGKRVVNTRAAHQAAELDALLVERGAFPLAYPCIAIVPGNIAQLERSIIQLFDGRFAWLIVTSANAVIALADLISELALTRPSPSPFSVAAVGPVTAAAVEQRLGIIPAVVPTIHSAAHLAAEIVLAPGDRVLLPQSEIADPALERLLTEAGAAVTTVTAYRTATGAGGVDLPAQLARGEVDAVLFASASAVDGLVARLTAAGCDPSAARHLPVVCIGPTTAAVARRHGFTEIHVADQATRSSAIDALELAFAQGVLYGDRSPAC